MKVIVIGSGMGGMCAALALRTFGHEVEVYERVKQLLPVGAAISVWPNGVKCLDFLGLADEARRLGGHLTDMAYIDGFSGETMCEFSLEPLVEEVGERPYPMARAELQDMLHEKFGRDLIHYGTELVEITEDDAGIVAHFADGTSDRADLLVGADGTHSVTREYVRGGPTERRYAGYVNYNGLLASDPQLAPVDRWTTWVGDGKRVSLMPVSDDRFYVFLDVPAPAGLPNDRATYRSDLHEAFSGWDSHVHEIIDRLDTQRLNRVEIHDVEPWHEWVRGRAVLVGDAAHCTTPDIGQGGCQAMEDAVALALTLQVNSLGLDDALRRYVAKRSPRAAELVLRARKRCDVTHGADPAVTADWYEELRSETGERVRGGIIANIVGNPLD